MTNETKIKHLQRAGIAFIITGLGYLYFGFPFWFQNAEDIPASQITHKILPVLWLRNELFPVSIIFWVQLISVISIFIGLFSLKKSGEPVGFGTKRSLFFVPMAGAISYIIGTWFIVPFTPLGALLCAIGMILVGIATLKSRIWTDWKRYIPLLIGLFPFIFMYPIVYLTGQRAYYTIGFWGIPWFILGIASWLRSQDV